MERRNAWKSYTPADIDALEDLSSGYIDFISRCKTERECTSYAINRAEEAGYIRLQDAIATGRALKPGDKVWAHVHGKALMLVHIGTDSIEQGLNILGAHIDSPRLDIKQNPVYESNGFALLDTHYYGGIKKYQWVTVPLAIHGVVAKKDGSVVNVSVGEDPADPVFCVTDLLPHLGSKQLVKKAAEVIEGEELDILVGNRPLITNGEKVSEEGAEEAEAVGAAAAGVGDAVEESAAGPVGAAARVVDAAADATDAAANAADAANTADATDFSSSSSASKDPVKAYLLSVLEERYGIEEEDFLSAELEVVPAGAARECGFDRSMVLGYGQDDRVCAYPSLLAQLAVESPQRTCVCLLVDKEEIGSVGATGMESQFFENVMAEVMELAGESGTLPLRRALSASSMLSSDVSAGFDPTFSSVFEAKNSAYLGRGLVFNKYTGSRGKSGSNDASAEFMARIRAIMDEAEVAFQTAELGRVDVGGGGTIAYIPAKYGMNVIDAGVPVLSMHSPWEVSSKADLYEAYKGYVAFLANA